MAEEKSTSHAMLETVGNLCSAVGWFVAGCGLIAVLGGAVNGDWGWVVVAAGAPAVLFGLLTAAAGQVPQCLVNIERNTKDLVNLMEEDEKGEE